MSVGEDRPVQCLPVAGVRLSATAAGIRYPDRLDLVLFEISEGSSVAGVFTRNAFCAAPVTLARSHLARQHARYFLINTGNANAGTGKQGDRDALASCAALAELAAVETDQVLPFSTGVIGEPLPVDRITAGLPAAIAALAPDNWASAARGIMTTDTRPKGSSRTITLSKGDVTISGICKGAGMIKPNMATMLAFICTDAEVEASALQDVLAHAVDHSFNRITVDGDTSTNDCCMLVATGQSGVAVGSSEGEDGQKFRQAVAELSQDLAQQLIKDAEGASKFITVVVSGGATTDECLRVGYAVAESPLVKTALFASDPNWGRILAAVGRSGIEDFDLNSVTIHLGETLLVSEGGRAASYQEALGKQEMSKDEISIRIDLARGDCEETFWTCDLSHEYIRVNAEYRT